MSAWVGCTVAAGLALAAVAAQGAAPVRAEAQAPAAASAAPPGAAAVDWREVVGAVLAAIGVVALGHGPASRRMRQWSDLRTERRRRRRMVRARWDVAEEARIERTGSDAGRPRRPAETVTTYAEVVGATVGDSSLGEIGREIDRYRYAAGAGDRADL